jgi:hypothetical protein
MFAAKYEHLIVADNLTLLIEFNVYNKSQKFN